MGSLGNVDFQTSPTRRADTITGLIFAPVSDRFGSETGNRRNRAALDPTRIGIKRDDALVSLNADLDQNIDPEVTQRGRNLDA
jgi:hypothetical protein